MHKRAVLLILFIVFTLLLPTLSSCAFQPILHEKFETLDNKNLSNSNLSNSNEGLKEAVGLAGMSVSKKVTLGGSVRENPALQIQVRSSEPHYWRGMVFDYYTGDGFEVTETQRTTYFPKTQLPYESKNRNDRLITQEFIIIKPQGPILFAAYEPSIVSDFKSIIEMDINQVLHINKGLENNETYSITSHIADFNPEDLRKSSVDYPLQIRDKYTQLTEIPNRVRDLANEVTASSNNPFDKVNNLNSYLKSSGNYHYNLTIKPPPPNRDAVDYFLFDSKEGYCVYFASAMVVMTRSIGIPARLVTGYAVGVLNPITETYDVIGTDAHAWVEVYFEGYGWVEFDPTAPTPGGYCTSCPRLSLGKKDGESKKGNENKKGTGVSNAPVITKLPTITIINSYPEIAYRGYQFKIDGYVSTLNGSGAENMEVMIFANKTKSTPGKLIGTSKTDSKGVFIANINLPLEFQLDTYNIIAKSIENSKYFGSDSDPKIVVKSKTVLTLNLKYEENILKIDGSLTDDSGKPIADNSVRIFINDDLKHTPLTDKNGRYSIELNIAPGEYDVKVDFSETNRYGTSSIIQHIDTVKKNVVITLSANPEYLDRNTTLNIIVRIESQNMTMDKAVLLITDLDKKIGEYLTNENGTISIIYKFPLNTTLGTHILTAEFNGDLTHNKAASTANVFLYSNTLITLFSDEQKVDSDGLFKINGTLSTDDFYPIGSKPINIAVGERIIGTVTTNELGEYSTSISASELGSGKFIVQTRFNSDSQLYKSSSSEKIEVEVALGLFWYLFSGVIASVLLIGIVYHKYGLKKSENRQTQIITNQKYQPKPTTALNPKECVIACYNSATKNLGNIGINKNREQTHWEFFQTVANIRCSISTNLKTLTQLYEEAYYSKHVIEEKHASQAKTLYSEIRENVEKR